MAGDPSQPETRRVGSGRPRGWCLGDDEGVKKTSLPLRKRGRTGWSDCVTFSDFVGIANDPVGEKRNRTKDTTPQEMMG